MIELTNTGLPIKLNESTNRLVFEDGASYDERSSKPTNKMTHVLAFPDSASDDMAYEFYQGVRLGKDKKAFQDAGLRYDMTVVYPGLVGIERKKTSGHHHKFIAGKTLEHPELYYVVSGEAAFILQPVNAEGGPEKFIVVKVAGGGKIIVPGNCTHGTVNIGPGALVFSDFVLDSGGNDYGGVGARRGLGVYVFENNGKIEFTRNKSYPDDISIFSGEVAACDSMGTAPGKPVYLDFLDDPDKFRYLREPGEYIEKINATLSLKPM